jgi:hypothetical protein
LSVAIEGQDSFAEGRSLPLLLLHRRKAIKQTDISWPVDWFGPRDSYVKRQRTTAQTAG